MKTVLFVDDHLEFRAIHAMYLQQNGYRVLAVGSGEEAVQQARSELPDLVLTDYSMPGMNGRGVAEQLKGDPATRHIPIVALTAHSYGAVGRELRNAGCDLVLAKPIEPDRVLREVRERIG